MTVQQFRFAPKYDIPKPRKSLTLPTHIKKQQAWQIIRGCSLSLEVLAPKIFSYTFDFKKQSRSEPTGPAISSKSKVKS